MVRASKAQSKAVEAATPGSATAEVMEVDQTKAVKPVSEPKKSQRGVQKVPASNLLNGKAKPAEKEMPASVKAPADSNSKAGRGRKRSAAADAVLQPTSKKSKVSSGSSSPPVQLTAPAVKDGVVLTVGMGDIGQLGLGPDVEEKTRVAVVPGLPNIVAVCAGGLHSVCLDEQGKVHTWGCNDEGALGRTTSCEEDNFSAGCVEGIEGRVVQITAGDCHTAALTHDGRVYAWGCFRDNSGPLGFLESGTIQRSPRLLPAGGEAIIKLASGNNHLALLSQAGRLYTCGCAESGQLGRLAERFASRDLRNRNGFEVLLQPAPVRAVRLRRVAVTFDDVWAGGENTFARDASTGAIFAWGLNNYNQMGDEDTSTKFQPTLIKSMADKKWKKFTSGQHHTVGLDSEGRVYTMGRHDYGRLGLGDADRKDAKVPTLIETLKQPVKDVSAAGCVSVAVTEEGVAYGFGMGTSSQMSQGDDEDCWEPKEFTGKQLAERKVVSVSVGGQHSIVLAVPQS
ncbi:regulator of chromosome condensation [Hyalella azteca]|uniref:Regulator of chromosome condensation n=1 Tax=Hyalella azteca TaxID=294128 RepID=A0A8B7PIT1_HYAAZ|nr:regulator of chromosome condensation [Hyalella azteca]